jgi:hypothetical protein
MSRSTWQNAPGTHDVSKRTLTKFKIYVHSSATTFVYYYSSQRRSETTQQFVIALTVPPTKHYGRVDQQASQRRASLGRQRCGRRSQRVWQWRRQRRLEPGKQVRFGFVAAFDLCSLLSFKAHRTNTVTTTASTRQLSAGATRPANMATASRTLLAQKAHEQRLVRIRWAWQRRRRA